MKLAELRAGFRTDAILHEFGAVITERSDCLVVRTPSNPLFYWGNALLLPRAPRNDELAHWLQRFDDEITRLQPASLHVAIGVDVESAGEDLPDWRAAGFTQHVTATMRLEAGSNAARMLDDRLSGAATEALAPLAALPALPALPAPVRWGPVSFPDDSERLIDLEILDADGFEPNAYRDYLRAQHRRYAQMVQAGRLQWFGLWADGGLVASCGLVRTAAAAGALGRFQRVMTHPSWRRRGLCKGLVARVAQWGFAQWGLACQIMCADPQDVAIGIYRSLGFEAFETDWGLERRAPMDRLPSAAPTPAAP